MYSKRRRAPCQRHRSRAIGSRDDDAVENDARVRDSREAIVARLASPPTPARSCVVTRGWRQPAARVRHQRDSPVMNLAVLGAQWGDEGKGKIVDLLTPHFRHRRALSGRPQRRPHGLRQRHEVRAAADPVRHPASRRHLRHRQRRGRRSRRRCSPRSTSWPARHRRRAAGSFVSDKAHLILPYHRELDLLSRGAARRAEDRHDLARHRSGLRGQDRAAAASASATSPIPQALEQNVRDNVARAQPAGPRLDDGLAAGARSSCVEHGERLRPWVGDVLADAARGDARRPVDPVRRRAGHAARHRSRHLSRTSPRRTRRLAASAPASASAARHRRRDGRGQGLHHARRRRAAADRAAPARWAIGCATAATSTAPSPAGRGAAAGTTRSRCATASASTASTRWR